MRILLVATEDWYVASHRLPVLIAAIDAGYEIAVVSRVGDHRAAIEDTGAAVIPISMAREGRNPASEAAVVRSLQRIYREYQPDLVHHVGLKPILYGGLAARFQGGPVVVQAFAGMGHLFTGTGARQAIGRAIAGSALRLVTRGNRTIVLVQNDDDAGLIREQRFADAARIRVIRGSGVDVVRFRASPIPMGHPVVVLPARLLRDKGVGEFVEAARLLRGRARFVLVGDLDPANPSSYGDEEVQRWVAEELVEWWGHRSDMPEVLSEATLVVLPSYREGMPKALLEAAACGRAIVTTDVPGCRDVVTPGLNGLLIPPRDPVALAAAIGQLLDDRAALVRMGRAGRERAEAEFGDTRVAAETLAIYQELLK